MMNEYEDRESFATALDQADPLGQFREEFHYPENASNFPTIYFCGNSLGLQPRHARHYVEEVLEDWERLAVEGHFRGKSPWYSYHEQFHESGANLVGAKPGEVVMMNSLTANLHFMLASFYQPNDRRHKILIDGPTFPSDTYAIKTHLEHRGMDVKESLEVIEPIEGSHQIEIEQVAEYLRRIGNETSLLLFSGVNFFTGQFIDIDQLTELARSYGCLIGFDLAHAVGNVALTLHDSNVDFAVWCNYKYVNAGPGAIGGCFVHERHGGTNAIGNEEDERFDYRSRLGGWWGNDPKTRFQMQLISEFIPQPGAAGWQVSNPPILAMAPLRASLELFEQAGMNALRAKSQKLTGYLEFLLTVNSDVDQLCIVTPSDPHKRGCQLSIVIRDHPRQTFERLEQHGVIGDFREPNVIRVAPVPLYNTFHEVWSFAQVLNEVVSNS